MDILLDYNTTSPMLVNFLPSLQSEYFTQTKGKFPQYFEWNPQVICLKVIYLKSGMQSFNIRLFKTYYYNLSSGSKSFKNIPI